MLALLLLVIATLAGLVLVARLPLGCGAWTRVGVGAAVGQLLLLWVPFLLAALFDLAAGAAGMAGMAVLVCVGLGVGLSPKTRIVVGPWLRRLRMGIFLRANRPLWVVGIAWMGLLGWLEHTHYLVPRPDGLHSAGVTWGDLPIHAALASRFVYAEGFAPLEHPLALHGALQYPFLPDYSVAVLTGLGLPLRWSFILGGLCPLAPLLLLLHGLTRLWSPTEAPWVSALAISLFLLAGGLGFGFVAAQLIDGAAPLPLLASTNATYLLQVPILKAGHIGNLLIAARSAAYGMPLGLCAVLVLGSAFERESPGRACFALAGVLAGALPLIHSHSFLVSAGVVICYLALGRQGGLRWLACLVPLCGAALPQLAWLAMQSGGRSSVRFTPGFLRPGTSPGEWLTDLVLGMGLWLLLAPAAWLAASPRTRRLSAPFVLLLPLANLVAFTPAVYDNVKLLAWFDVAAASLVAALIGRWFSPGRGGAPGRALRIAAAVVAIVGCSLSGALAVGYELTNDGLVVSNADLRLAELVRQHTPPSAVIATAANHHDPVAMFSGRRVVLAAPLMVRTHGIDVTARALELVQIYAGGERARELIARLGVSAIVVGPRERSDIPRIDESFLASEARAVHAVEGRRLYLLRPQATRWTRWAHPNPAAKAVAGQAGSSDN